MKNYIDLHMHSIYSDDGEFLPTELVWQCRDAGIRIMAVTDHNSVKANKEAKEEADRLGIRYIPAIEMDCSYQGIDLHILGYGINENSQDFAAVEEAVERQCIVASRQALKLTRELGFDLTEGELNRISARGLKKEIWTGEIFAEALLKKDEYLDHEILKPYRPGGIRSDNPYVNFFWDFYAQGKPCYVRMNYPDLEEAIDIIHRNGGKAVLAHPGVNLKEKRELLDEIIAWGLDGIEAFSSYHTEEAMKFFCQKSKEKNLFITCGSDFHGRTKPSIGLGQSGCSIDQAEIEYQLRGLL